MFIIFLSSLHVRVVYIQLTHTLDVEEKERNKKGHRTSTHREKKTLNQNVDHRLHRQFTSEE